MFKLSAPEELFANQTLYQIGDGTDKKLAPLSGQFRVAVVLPQPVSNLPDAVKEMVEKLIAACKIAAKDVVYADAASADVSYNALLNTYQARVILFFGDFPVSRNLKGLKRNVPYEFNGTKILLAQTLENIAKTPAEKSALWVALQKIFSLK